jgi:hypothetical protein
MLLKGRKAGPTGDPERSQNFSKPLSSAKSIRIASRAVSGFGKVCTPCSAPLSARGGCAAVPVPAFRRRSRSLSPACPFGVSTYAKWNKLWPEPSTCWWIVWFISPHRRSISNVYSSRSSSADLRDLGVLFWLRSQRMIAMTKSHSRRFVSEAL